MLSGFDERGQAIQIGAVLLFGILVVSFASYQAFVVPNQNEQVEFQHNQNVRSQMIEVRSDILNAGTSESVVSGSVTLGTSFPARVVAVNPPAPTGSLRTADFSGGSSLVVANAEATDSDIDDFWSGANRQFTTSKLVYQPNYAVYQNAPTTVYENTVVLNQFRSQTLLNTGQTLVNGREVDLTVLQGTYKTSQSGSVSLSFSAPAGNTETISVQRANAGNPVTLRVPTSIPVGKWEELLGSQRATNGGYITGLSKSGGVLEIELQETDAAGNPILYELRVSAVGVGADIPEPEPEYLTTTTNDRVEVETGETRTLITAVNNKFNGPESGVVLSTTASSGTAAVIGASDDQGNAEVEYTAPSSTGTETVTVEKDLDESGNIEADERVQYTVSVVGSGSSGDSTAPAFNSGPTADPSTVAQGEQFDLSATLSDVGNGGTDIVSASWSDGQGNSGTLTADDGEFDQPEEAVSNNVYTDGWREGDHTISVTGTDANGNSVSGTTTVTVNTGDPLPANAVAFDDRDNNGVYDSSEDTYTENDVKDFDQSDNLIIEKDVSSNKIGIKASSVTVRSGVTLSATNGQLTIETESGGLDVTGATLEAGKSNQEKKIELKSSGDIDVRDATLQGNGDIKASPSGTLFLNENGGDRADGGTYIEDFDGNPATISLEQGAFDGSPEKGSLVDNS